MNFKFEILLIKIQKQYGPFMMINYQLSRCDTALKIDLIMLQANNNDENPSTFSYRKYNLINQDDKMNII